MTREEIISGLKFTIEMFLFDPSTGETFKEPRNDMDKTTIDACRGAIELLEQEPKAEKIIKMRDATPEEKESIDKYIKSISKPTGVDFWNLEQAPCDDAISREAVLLAIDGVKDNYGGLLDVARMVRKLPPVNPQPKTDTLDKIRGEILVLDDADYDFDGYYKAVTDALKIIDKYKAESEG